MFLRSLLRCKGIAAIAAAVVLATTVTPLGVASGLAARSQAPITLTFWTWVPHLQEPVRLFEQTHPGIKVNIVNAGQGSPELTKLRIALKAGAGAPDDVQIPEANVPEFELSGKLVDLSAYGANSVKNQFLPAAWAQVSVGSKVYAIPQDTGPMALLYRKDIFDKYHLAVPTTWAQYAQEALALHKANPAVYMTDFPPGEGLFTIAMMWQAGARNFTVNGSTVSVNFTDPASLRVINYWGNLYKERAVQISPDFTTPWYTAMANGTYASWVTAAWGPLFLEGIAAKSAGKWRVASLPQWTPGAHVSTNWSGSTTAVTTQSAHPKEAATFAMWLNANPTSSKMLVTKALLFPQRTALLNDPALLNAHDPFFGGQQVFRVFVQSLTQGGTIQWSPVQDYVNEQMTNDIGSAAAGKMTFAQSLQKLQSDVISYSRAQGFTIK